jgi:hypothetical protein
MISLIGSSNSLLIQLATRGRPVRGAHAHRMSHTILSATRTDREPLNDKARNTLQPRELEWDPQAEPKQARYPVEPDAQAVD